MVVLYRQPNTYLYRPTYITVDYEDLDHYHCRLLTPGIGYGIRARARSLYSVVVGVS